VWWFILVIPATLVADTGDLGSKASLEEKQETQGEKWKITKSKGPGAMAQMVEHQHQVPELKTQYHQQ
jgi:hypothetical protein